MSGDQGRVSSRERSGQVHAVMVHSPRQQSVPDVQGGKEKGHNLDETKRTRMRYTYEEDEHVFALPDYSMHECKV